MIPIVRFCPSTRPSEARPFINLIYEDLAFAKATAHQAAFYRVGVTVLDAAASLGRVDDSGDGSISYEPNGQFMKLIW